MSEPALDTWVSDHVDSLSIDFLSWVAVQETAAEGSHRQQIGELGGKLMALREGFPLCSSPEETKPAVSLDANTLPQTPAAGLPVASSHHVQRLSEAVCSSAALGLSLEGMKLLEQQAAALEATIGTTRARSLVEIIGRKRLETSEEAEQVELLAQPPDAARRILEVLVQVDSKEERAAMLADAFTPPTGDAFDTSTEELEEVFTTPLQLLAAVDLWLERGSGLEPSLLPSHERLGMGESTEAMDWNGEGESSRFIATLRELREEILTLWDSGSGEDF